MIYTSYFAKLRRLPKDIISVSIALYSPKWYKGLEYKALAPKSEILEYWKKSQESSMVKQHKYKQDFCEKVLNNLDREQVLRDLGEMLGFPDKFWYKRDDMNIVLLCYESSKEFCHRHIVADWFAQEEVEVKEWDET